MKLVPQPWHFAPWQRRAAVLVVLPRRLVVITATTAYHSVRLFGALWRCEVAAECAMAARWWRGR
jgi:hypothetical protein